MDTVKDYFAAKFNIVTDGVWNGNEVIAAAVAVIVFLVLIFAAAKLIGALSRRINPRKDTIFSHRKNKYKNKIGKKVKYK